MRLINSPRAVMAAIAKTMFGFIRANIAIIVQTSDTRCTWPDVTRSRRPASYAGVIPGT
jgi:hypothetical protein